ncbi:MAG: TSUP family transporter [Proteobacteria bacterium]|nr:TSUP family transporter [Pseudomonadota bacterium]
MIYTAWFMDLLTLVAFLLIVLLGSYVQAVAGFAMGMIIIAVIGGTQLMDLPVLAAVASFLSLINVLFAMKGHWQHLSAAIFPWLALGQIPAIFVGVWLLNVLNSDDRHLLEILLGLFITLGSLSMMLRPQPIAKVSGPVACVSAGVVGGLVGGMFSASGPVMGWFTYRQPLPVSQIRATLLVGFALTTTTRTLVVGAQGGLTAEVWLYTGMAIPVVLIGTWAGRSFVSTFSEQAM